jgi:hypothetical protein
MFTFLMLLSSFAAFAQSDRDPLPLQRASHDVTAAYDALAPLDRQERTAILRTMTPAKRAAVWQAHINAVVSAHPELNAQQREAIGAVARVVVPALFDRTPDRDLDRQAARVEIDIQLDHARPLLPVELVTELFYRIGANSTSSLTRVQFPTSSDATCDCANIPGDPCYGSCFGLCARTQDGCGPFGTDGCGGLCH